MALSL